MNPRLNILYYGLVLSLCNPILLWVVGYYQLPLDPYFFAKGVVDAQTNALNAQGSQGTNLGQLRILTTVTSVRIPLHFML